MKELRKELSIEQKAKAYDNIIEKANKIHNENCEVCQMCIKELIPELKESSDERIMKAMIDYFKWNSNGQLLNEFSNREVFDWLEKLDKNSIEPNWCHHKVDLSECPEEYRKAYYDGWNNCNMQHSQCKSDSNDVIKCLINGMKFYYDDIPGATWGTDKWSMPVKHIIEALEAINKEVVEEGTKKHKFDVGNWITDISGRVWRIDDINDEGYLVSMYEKGYVTILPFTIDNIYSLWNIKDAKDGDILATEDNCICIFDNTLEEGKYPFAYCGLTRYVFEIYDRRLPFTHDNVHPATKEQCELLFQKMKEAGYEWDSNRKELKEIGQKPIDEEMQGEQQIPAKWSEDDSKHLERILRELENQCQRPSNRPYLDEIESDYDWIRSIKDRVLHRQEWDEEGQVRMNRIISNLKNLKVARNDILLKDIDWLKSIRPQPQWKPSDEQLYWLKWVAHRLPDTEKANEAEAVLEELLEQLKKLREE